MKRDDLILLAMAGAAVFLLPKILKKGAGSSGTSSSSSGKLDPWVYEVARDSGWVYYSDGTSIGPDGTYYKGSDVVYSPGGMYAG